MVTGLVQINLAWDDILSIELVVLNILLATKIPSTLINTYEEMYIRNDATNNLFNDVRKSSIHKFYMKSSQDLCVYSLLLF